MEQSPVTETAGDVTSSTTAAETGLTLTWWPVCGSVIAAMVEEEEACFLPGEKGEGTLTARLLCATYVLIQKLRF